MTGESRLWSGAVALGVGLLALGAIVLGFAVDERLFGFDSSNVRAHGFAEGVALLAALAVVLGLHGGRGASRRARALAVAGMGIGMIALLGTALFVFGTMLAGG